MKQSNINKKGVAFLEGNTWYYRSKRLEDDGTIKYEKIEGVSNREEAERQYHKADKEFRVAVRKYLLENKKIDDISFKDYLIYWFEDVYSARIQNTTKMVGSYTLYNLILPNIEKDIKLKYVTVDYLDSLLQVVANVSRSAGNRGREFLSIALSEALIEGYIQKNIVLDTKPYKRSSPKVRVLSRDKIRILLEAASFNNWYLEILLGLFCGLRKGEILGLKFRDFDLDEKTVTINRQLVADPQVERGAKINRFGVIEREPKTENSYRTIRIPEIVLEEVKKRYDVISFNKKRLAERYNDNDYVSCQEDGSPRSLSAMNTALGKMCKRNGLPLISVHSLRHMYATILIEQGETLAKISALLGHSSVVTTFEYYCEVMDEEENVIAFINDLFSQAS